MTGKVAEQSYQLAPRAKECMGGLLVSINDSKNAKSHLPCFQLPAYKLARPKRETPASYGWVL